MTTGFVLLFIAWAVSTCCNIFLLWYLQKVLRNNDKDKLTWTRKY